MLDVQSLKGCVPVCANRAKTMGVLPCKKVDQMSQRREFVGGQNGTVGGERARAAGLVS